MGEELVELDWAVVGCDEGCLCGGIGEGEEGGRCEGADGGLEAGGALWSETGR